jgi:hypothetical protein
MYVTKAGAQTAVSSSLSNYCVQVTRPYEQPITHPCCRYTTVLVIRRTVEALCGTASSLTIRDKLHPDATTDVAVMHEIAWQHSAGTSSHSSHATWDQEDKQIYLACWDNPNSSELIYD